MNTTTAEYASTGSQQCAEQKGECPLSRNISRGEQQLSTWGGAALVAAGLMKGRLSGLLLTLAGGGLLYRGWTGHCHTYDMLGIDTSEEHAAGTVIPSRTGTRVDEAVTVNRSADELFDFWQNLENLPSVMQHLDRVEQQEGDRSHWIAKGPFDQRVEWDAEIIEKKEGEMISWRSLPGSQVDTAGSVHFKSAGNGRGTTVRVSLKYNPPGGRVTTGLAWLFGMGLKQQLHEDLARFKSVLEAGEAPTVTGQPQGR
ncbi:MAG: cyclase [Planctomyces sp.]|nr:cyclase [Planctomyces sp.]